MTQAETDNPYQRFHRAQRTFDGMERQRDELLLAYVQDPSAERQTHVFEAMNGLRSARREVHAATISLMYFLSLQESDADAAYAMLKEMAHAHERRISALEAHVQAVAT